MYNLKRILESIIDVQTDPVAVREKAAEALIEMAVLEKQATEAPQEMRDFFAGAACIGCLSDSNVLGEPGHVSGYSWDMSDAMMTERAKRIEQRRAANPPDSIGE